MRFLLDENIHKRLYEFLRNEGHDVSFSSKGISDDEVFKIAVKEERALLTRDADFLNYKFTGPNHKGILLIRVHARDSTSQIEILSKLIKEHSPFENKVVKLMARNSIEFL